MFGLLSGSIESKLKVLEEQLKKGKTSDSLTAIQDLRNDVRILKTYSEPKPKSQVFAENQRLVEEMSRLKNLVYLTFASCGLMLAGLAGVWLKNRHRLQHQPIAKAYLGHSKN